MTDNPFSYRPARPGEEDRLAALVAECFAWNAAGGRKLVDRLTLDRWRVVERDRHVVGMAALIESGHWVGGGVVPSALVAVLGTESASRGGGLAKYLIAELLYESRMRGIALSTLYPASRTLYRKLGYDAGGMRLWYETRPREIAMSDRALPIRRLRPDDARRVRAVYDRVASQGSGWLARPDYKWDALLHPTDRELFAWLIGSDDNPRGYFIASMTAEPGNKKLVLEDHAVADAAAARRLLTYLSDMSMQLNTVRWCGQPRDPLRALIPEAKVTVAFSNEWFLRVVDVKGALETRPWPRGISATWTMAVHDDVFADNTGPWRVEVADGRARVTRTEQTSTITLDVRALAALFLSHRHPRDLVQVGLMQAGDADAELLGAAFSGPLPSLSDDF